MGAHNCAGPCFVRCLFSGFELGFPVMRVGICVVLAIVAGAGVAFAQSDWVVDPWAPVATAAPVAPRAPQQALRVAASSRLAVSEQWVDERNFELTDPWLDSAPSQLGAPAASKAPRALSRTSSAAGEWAKPVPLLVDPWATEPRKASAPPVDLIVDPWAKDGSGP